jgi:hypothetical protein
MAFAVKRFFLIFALAKMRRLLYLPPLKIEWTGK